jgi:hypothetical protein
MKTKEKAGANGKVHENRIAGLDTPPIMKPRNVTFLLKGVSDLLQNNPAEFIGKTESVELTAAKKVYNDEEEAKLRLYRLPEGQLGHPTQAVIRAVIRAVTGKKFGKTPAPQLIKGAVFPVETFAVLERPNGEPLHDYAIDRRSVVVGKARVLRCRPRFANWRMRVALEVDTALISPEMVAEAMNLAGRIVGIGDGRPEKGLGFGRFTAEIVT